MSEFFNIIKDILKGNLSLSELPGFIAWLFTSR